MTRATKNTSGWNYGKPDIDKKLWQLALLNPKTASQIDVDEAAQALYHRLAAEAVDAYWDDKAEEFVKALPIDKLKAIMEIKEYE